MKRVIFGLMFLALIGCTPQPEQRSSATKGIDYAGWKEMTEKPIRVDEQVFAMCAAARPGDERDKATKERGPHYVPAVRIYANDVGAAAYRKGTGTMPVGSTIIKEKWWNEKDTSASAYAAMIKREAGYDPANGDWEYVFVTRGEQYEETRGKMESCIACHKSAAAKDYLFRPNVKAE